MPRRLSTPDAALHVADSNGVDAVSMRRVAEELDTGASALYVYVENRDDLLDAMFDQVMAPVAEATDAGIASENLEWLAPSPASTPVRSIRAKPSQYDV